LPLALVADAEVYAASTLAGRDQELDELRTILERETP
jgi:hypothetical protein